MDRDAELRQKLETRGVGKRRVDRVDCDIKRGYIERNNYQRGFTFCAKQLMIYILVNYNSH